MGGLENHPETMIVRGPNFEVEIKCFFPSTGKNTRIVFVHRSVSLQLFPVVRIFLRSPVSFVSTDEFLVMITKITSRIGVS